MTKKSRRVAKARRALLSLSLVLVVAFAAVGGTIAWLTDKTESLTNTFTVGNIDITLTETTGEEYKMVPGNTIEKDPTVTVVGGSEDAWVFVKIEEAHDLSTFIDYEVDDAWTALNGYDGVYYLEYTAADTDTEYSVLDGNAVTVNGETVTKAMLDAIAEGSEPTLTFTAYAIQKDNFNTAAAAWTEVSK